LFACNTLVKETFLPFTIFLSFCFKDGIETVLHGYFPEIKPYNNLLGKLQHEVCIHVNEF
jgi:hypothetical protein